MISILFFSACGDTKNTQGKEESNISATEKPEVQSSATETPIPAPSATETSIPQPSATEPLAEEKITPVSSEEETVKAKVTQKIWEAFEGVKSSKDIQWTGPYHELLLESRGTLHIAMITRKPVTKTERNIYQGEEMVYLVFYDESKDEAPHFVCKYGNMFEADISSDEESMYLSLITRHDFGEIEFYDSLFYMGLDGCFCREFACLLAGQETGV